MYEPAKVTFLCLIEICTLNVTFASLGLLVPLFPFVLVRFFAAEFKKQRFFLLQLGWESV